MRIQNPILPGFHPDPSICKAGGGYYLVTSSFEYFPGVPLFFSRDLLHWRQLGHCLTRPSQLPLQRARSSGGIFAPTLRWHAGRFYMVTTNVTGGGSFYVHSEDPAAGWSEPVWVDQGGIDPSLCFDADGTVYYTGTHGGQIIQREIDLATGRFLTPARPIWDGTGGQYPEGPHLYAMHGYYYLLISEGGTEYGHMLTVARSTSSWGPFESCPRNPILTHRSLSNPIQATGHADLVQDDAGHWWLVCLGIRPHSYPPCHNLGRETFLAPVTWDSAGWPVVGRDGLIELEMSVDRPTPAEAPEANLNPWNWTRDDFDAPQLHPSWNYLRNPAAANASLSERPGCLRLRGSAITLDEPDSPAFVGRRQQHASCQVRARLDFQPDQPGAEAGLTVWMNERHHYDLLVSHSPGGRQLVCRRRIGSLQAQIGLPLPAVGPLELILRATPESYQFACSAAGQSEVVICEAETRYLSTETAGGFTGVYFAMAASGGAAPADFDWFEYLPQ